MDLDRFIGQKAIKDQVRTQLEFCKQNNQLFPHTLLVASAGQGKSTLANAIAKAIEKPVVQVFCPGIKTVDDLYDALTISDDSYIAEGTVVLCDEIHQLPLKVAENLYTLMENFTLTEDGVKYRFPHFTLIGATTEPQMMSKPLRDRFINQFVFEPYNDADVLDYIKADGRVWAHTNVAHKMAVMCHYTPRLMNSFLYKMQVYCSLNKRVFFNESDWPKFLMSNGYSPEGLTALEERYVRILHDQERASLATMANLLGMKPNMVANIVEPSLISYGYIELAIGGRKLTEEGMRLWNTLAQS